MAEQGLSFVGFLQQPGGGACFLGHWDPEELSSLHSSPSPIHRHPLSPTEPRQARPDHPDRRRSEPWDLNGGDEEADEEEEEEDPVKPDLSPLRCVSGLEIHHGATSIRVGRRPRGCRSSGPTWLDTTYAISAADGGPRPRLPDVRLSNQRSSAPDNWFSSPDLQSNNDDDNYDRQTRRKSSGLLSPAGRRRKQHLLHAKKPPKTKISPFASECLTVCSSAGLQLFALYNHTGALHNPPRYYSLRVPLHLKREAGLVTEVDAHWLDHMTQHFTAGAQLVDGFFHLEGSSSGRTHSHARHGLLTFPLTTFQ